MLARIPFFRKRKEKKDQEEVNELIKNAQEKIRGVKSVNIKFTPVGPRTMKGFTAIRKQGVPSDLLLPEYTISNDKVAEKESSDKERIIYSKEVKHLIKNIESKIIFTTKPKVYRDLLNMYKKELDNKNRYDFGKIRMVVKKFNVYVEREVKNNNMILPDFVFPSLEDEDYLREKIKEANERRKKTKGHLKTVKKDIEKGIASIKDQDLKKLYKVLLEQYNKALDDKQRLDVEVIESFFYKLSEKIENEINKDSSSDASSVLSEKTKRKANTTKRKKVEKEKKVNKTTKPEKQINKIEKSKRVSKAHKK